MPRYSRMLIAVAIAIATLVGAAVLGSRTMAQTTTTPGTVTYHYDSLGRLVQDIYPANSLGYNYDAAGNRTAFTIN
jgi:YD repeat-containing protein